MFIPWNPNVQPGDRLVYHDSGWKDLIVDHIKGAQAVCVGGKRVRLRDGYVLESSNRVARRMTPELEVAIQRDRALEWTQKEAPGAIAKLPTNQILYLKTLIEALQRGHE